MIPWKMWFNGIRDYEGTKMDLSGQQEHVLITGPNGAGKSTITYCMGAVLYSSKVDLEGLRSRNLPPDEIWKAHIRLLFKNEGRVRIDAPAYIQFSLSILQEPGQPVKKEFAISSGDAPDQWEDTVRYTSGDRQRNFTAYKKDLQYKYKIDPDMFYLIWYQQEVNQFAVMHPEERFRNFAEMHGIDQVQRNWEESLEKLKETEETLRQAENNVAYKKQVLKMKKNELDRYEDNQRRLLEGGKLYARSLLQLEAFFKREREQLSSQIEQLELEKEQQQELIHEIKVQEADVHDKLTVLQHEIDQLNMELSGCEDQLQALETEIKETQTAISNLEQELSEVNQEKERIKRTEDEVKRQLDDVALQLSDTLEQVRKINVEIENSEGRNQELLESIARIGAAIDQDQKEEIKHRERLHQYVSSHHVLEELDRLEQTLAAAKDTRQKHEHSIRELKEELARLNDENDWSRRQMESLAYFNARGIRAYALRELIELDESARLKAEELFNAIKYTIFFDGHKATVPNDLYHVPLRKVVPDRSVTELASLQIRVKEGLKEEVFPHAVKALWWVEQFFKDGDVRIEDGMLLDAMGIRGPQEQNRYILSARALMARKKEVENSINELSLMSGELQEAIQQDTKRLQELNGIIHLVREAEAFMTMEYERVNRGIKWQEEQARQVELLEQLQELRQAHTGLIENRLKLEHDRAELEQEAEFYVRLGQQKEKYEELHAKRRAFRGLSERKEELKHGHDNTEDQLGKLEKELRRKQRELEDIQDQQEREEGKLRRIHHQLQQKVETYEDTKESNISTIQELEDFKQLAPHIYNEVATEESLESENVNKRSTLAQLRSDLESGRVKFNHARQEAGIDPAAPENYKVVEEEYDRIQDEYKRTSLLFEQDQERAEQLKDQLETTINMRVLEIQQRFKSYMSHFQFEGEIDWDQYEDRRGRTHFNLFIKARKEGHRGTLEDVSVKARGGKVGKGVSGGEESLSSLLFALALLQNLQTAPGFIVLDEFDSALDEQRKLKVFDLYGRELERKLIILTPKSHEKSYLDRFSKAYIVNHDPTVPRSKVTGLIRKD